MQTDSPEKSVRNSKPHAKQKTAPPNVNHPMATDLPSLPSPYPNPPQTALAANVFPPPPFFANRNAMENLACQSFGCLDRSHTGRQPSTTRPAQATSAMDPARSLTIGSGPQCDVQIRTSLGRPPAPDQGPQRPIGFDGPPGFFAGGSQGRRIHPIIAKLD